MLVIIGGISLRSFEKVDEKSDIWKLPDLIEKILSAGVQIESQSDTQAKRVRAMLAHLKPIMRECKREVNLIIFFQNLFLRFRYH